MREGLLHDVPAATYHADDFGETPTLSCGIAKLLLDAAPIKAKMAHPRLAGAPIEESEPTRPKEIGTAAHKLILGRGRDLVEILAPDFKKGAAREARAQAYDDGLCPILEDDNAIARDIAASVALGLGKLPDCAGFFGEGAASEVVVVARDPSGAWLRIMIDRLELREDRAIIWDVKTGEQSAAPHGLGTRVAGMSWDVTAAFYSHVLALALPRYAGRVTNRFLLVENDAPHLCLPVELDATAREMGRRKVAYAIALWTGCLESGEWPGYPAAIVVPEFPSWAESRWLAREEAYEAMGVRPALPPGAHVPKTLTEPV